MHKLFATLLKAGIASSRSSWNHFTTLFTFFRGFGKLFIKVMNIVHKRKKASLSGDTLIEVMFSVGIFGMVAVSAISLMNRGLYTAQGTLETTMARNEIDTQAEALRFIHDAYSSKKRSATNVYKTLWEAIIGTDTGDVTIEGLALEHDDAKFAKFLDAYEAVAAGGDGADYNTCDDLYSSGVIPAKSFILNTSKLDEASIQSFIHNGQLRSDNDILIPYGSPDNTTITSTPTYPRLYYGDSALSDATDTSVAQQILQSAQGILVTAVASEAGDDVSCEGEAERNEPDYYDFYIHTCWDSPGGGGSRTISTTVRLYNSDQISLNQNRQVQYETVDFVDPAWTIYQWGKDVGSSRYVTPRTTIDQNNIVDFRGDGSLSVDAGVYYEIEPNGSFMIETDINTSNIKTHPGGFLKIRLGALYAQIYGDGGIIMLMNEAGNELACESFRGSRVSDKSMPCHNNGTLLNNFRIPLSYGCFLDRNRKIDDRTDISTSYCEYATLRTKTFPGKSETLLTANQARLETAMNGKVAAYTDSSFHLRLEVINGTDYIVYLDPYGAEEATNVVFQGSAPNNGNNLKATFGLAHNNHACPVIATASLTHVKMGIGVAQDNSTVSRCGNKFKLVYCADSTCSTSKTYNISISKTAVISDNEFPYDSRNFLNWNTSPDGSGVTYRPDDSVDFGAKAGDEVKLYAQWEDRALNYTVYYRSNDASDAIESTGAEMALQGTSYNVKTAASLNFSRADYEFVNWNTERDGSGKTYYAGDPITISGDITLYAQWRRILRDYTITYHGNGDTDAEGNVLNSTRSTVERENNSYTIEGAGSFYREAYKISGWNTAANGSGTSYSIGQKITISENLDLYAVWKVNDAGSGHATIELPSNDKLFNTLLLAPRFVTNSFINIYVGDSDLGIDALVTRAGVSNGYYACENPPCSANSWGALGLHLPATASGGTGVIYLNLAEGHRINSSNKQEFVFYYSNVFTVDQASSATIADDDCGMGYPQLHLYSSQYNSYKISDHQKAHKISGADASASLFPSYWIIGKLTWTNSGLQLTPINQFTNTKPGAYL